MVTQLQEIKMSEWISTAAKPGEKKGTTEDEKKKWHGMGEWIMAERRLDGYYRAGGDTLSMDNTTTASSHIELTTKGGVSIMCHNPPTS